MDFEKLAAEALKHPGGWVYEIEGAFTEDEFVPPQAIVRCWKVDDEGKITGETQANPNYVHGFGKKYKQMQASREE
jgi:hypothetical protein